MMLASGSSEAMGVFFALGLILAFGLIAFEMHRADKRRRIWAAVAQRYGLTVIGKDHLVGDVDGVAVLVEIFTRGSGKNSSTYTRVRASGGLPHDIELGREGFFSSSKSDHETGDKAFDGAVKVKGDAGLALALLDEPTRAIVMAAVGDGWTYSNGAWGYEVLKRLGLEIEDRLTAGVALAKDMRAASQAIAPRLAERVASDPNAGVKVRALEYLLEHFHDTPALETALAAALHGEDAALRLIAATKLRDSTVLAGIAGDRELAPPIRADALREACAYPGDAAMVAVVDQLVDELAEGALSPKLCVGLAQALAVVPNERAEATLIRLLDSTHDAVPVEAMKALGKVGTVAAVPALIPFRDRFLAFAMTSAGAAKDAILRIQARTGHSEAGALALTDVQSGLAIVESEDA